MAKGAVAGSRGSGESKRAHRYLSPERRIRARLDELANLGSTIEFQQDQRAEQITDLELANERGTERLEQIDEEVETLKAELAALPPPDEG